MGDNNIDPEVSVIAKIPDNDIDNDDDSDNNDGKVSSTGVNTDNNNDLVNTDEDGNEEEVIVAKDSGNSKYRMEEGASTFKEYCENNDYDNLIFNREVIDIFESSQYNKGKPRQNTSVKHAGKAFSVVIGLGFNEYSVREVECNIQQSTHSKYETILVPKVIKNWNKLNASDNYGILLEQNAEIIFTPHFTFVFYKKLSYIFSKFVKF